MIQEKEIEASRETAKMLSSLIEKGLEKLKGAVPEKGVVDPEKWITVHKPELLQDKEIVACLKTWEVMGGKKDVKKFLKRKVRRDYKIWFSRKDVIIDAIGPNVFFINIAKSMVKELEYHHADSDFWLNSKEISVIFTAFTNFVSEILTDEVYEVDYKIEMMEFLKNFLEKKMLRRKSISAPSLNEDGTVGEFKYEKSEKEMSMIEFLKGKYKSVVESSKEIATTNNEKVF